MVRTHFVLILEVSATMRYAYYPSPFGTLQIGHKDGAVVSITRAASSFTHDSSPVSDLANIQLQEYFLGKRRSFDFPMSPEGTPFQLSVWNELRQIPYGETRTYGQIAAAVGKPGAARAVGMACNRNPLWIVVPCHRVLGSNHALTGYAGGLDMKRALLTLEQP